MPLTPSFSTLRLSSHNVQASKDFYQKLFDQAPVEDLPNFVSFKLNDVHLDISEADEKSPSSTGGAVGYWLVDSLDLIIKRACGYRHCR